MLLRALLNAEADLDIVGLYNAGFVLTITYSGMVFSAMETDYFRACRPSTTTTRP